MLHNIQCIINQISNCSKYKMKSLNGEIWPREINIQSQFFCWIEFQGKRKLFSVRKANYIMSYGAAKNL